MRMLAVRSALSGYGRQGARRVVSQGSRALNVPASSPDSGSPVPALSAQELVQNIERSAANGAFIKRTKLSSYLKSVKTSEELAQSKTIMKIYEQKRVDPDSNAAGLLVKKALELDQPDLVLEVLENNYRIGLFLEPSTMNKLLHKFMTNGEHEKVFQLHELAQHKYRVKSSERTFDILIRSAITQEDLTKAVELLQTAAAARKLQRVTCNNLLFKLKSQGMQEQIDQVAAAMQEAGITPNETTNKILQQ